MDYENKIEFYKNRSFGERLSSAADFLRQNWKVFYKNLLIPAIPFILLLAYTLPEYVKWAQIAMPLFLQGGDPSAVLAAGSFGLLFFPVMMCFSLYLFAMSGAIMKLYEEGGLTDKTSWNDLSGRMFSNAGKIFLVGLAMLLIVIVASLIIGLLIGTVGAGLRILLVILLIFGLIAVWPPLYMIIFPTLFRGASVWKSIGDGLRVGFKNWGTTFGVLFIAELIGAIVSYVFILPVELWILFNPGQASVEMYVFAVLLSLALVLIVPFVFVFLAFQYFAIAEKEEGISLQNKIDSFDNL
ncbi:MAG: hypothetical protein FWD60_12595 [Candidatus Azobacteroides sp.]|nr:hypothetical protein [Candidatus Azobacteroides sp.]